MAVLLLMDFDPFMTAVFALVGVVECLFFNQQGYLFFQNDGGWPGPCHGFESQGGPNDYLGFGDFVPPLLYAL